MSLEARSAAVVGVAAAATCLLLYRHYRRRATLAAELEVPTIDVSPFLEWLESQPEHDAKPPQSATAVAAAWRHAFSTFGFAHLSGHGIADHVIDNAYSMARAFHEVLTIDRKMAVSVGQLNQNGRGYR